MELQDTRDLAKTFLVYQGSSSFDELAGLARQGGLEAIKKEGDWRKWD